VADVYYLVWSVDTRLVVLSFLHGWRGFAWLSKKGKNCLLLQIA
jgi:hypothetical protein